MRQSQEKSNLLLKEMLEQAQRQAKLGENALIALQEANHELKLHQLIFDQTSEAVMVTDTTPKIINVNAAFTAVTGYTKEEAIGKNPNFLHSGKQEAGFYSQLWNELKTNGHWEGEIYNRKKNGDIYPEWLSITTIKHESNDKLNCYVGLFTDITRRKRQEKKLTHYAFHDPLTGLPNQRTLMEKLTESISKAKKNHLKVDH